MLKYIEHPVQNKLKVSSCGKVFSTGSNRELAQFFDVTRGLHVSPCERVNGKKIKKRIQVKTLVWETYKGSIDEGKSIRHKDLNAKNCDLTNLIVLSDNEYIDYNCQRLAEEGWKRHPKFSNYLADVSGNVIHAVKRSILKGHKSDGYVVIGVCLGGKQFGIAKQAFVWECFFGQYERTKYQVHHINGVRDDNQIINLQKVTIQEHGKKPKSKSLTRSASNERSINCVTNGQTYKSISIAAKLLFPKRSIPGRKGIHQVLSGKLKKYKNMVFEYVEAAHVVEEKWKQILDDDIFDSIEISNKGRIKLKTGKISTGSLCGGNKRVNVINSKGKTRLYQIHYLVCRAFHGPPPGDWSSNRISVDHINMNHSDNDADNLRWSNPIAQAQNKVKNNSIEAKTISNNVWMTFPSQTAAAVHFNVERRFISQVCTGKRKHLQNIVFRFKVQRR